MSKGEQKKAEMNGQEIVFGFFEDVLHLKEVQTALGRTAEQRCQKEERESKYQDGLTQEEICRTWKDAWFIPGTTVKKSCQAADRSRDSCVPPAVWLWI